MSQKYQVDFFGPADERLYSCVVAHDEEGSYFRFSIELAMNLYESEGKDISGICSMVVIKGGVYENKSIH